MRLRPACVVCHSAPAVEGGLCTPDIVALASEAGRAYDLVVERDPNLSGCRYEFLRRVVFCCIDDGHLNHVEPNRGCPFCSC